MLLHAPAASICLIGKAHHKWPLFLLLIIMIMIITIMIMIIVMMISSSSSIIIELQLLAWLAHFRWQCSSEDVCFIEFNVPPTPKRIWRRVIREKKKKYFMFCSGKHAETPSHFYFYNYDLGMDKLIRVKCILSCLDRIG